MHCLLWSLILTAAEADSEGARVQGVREEVSSVASPKAAQPDALRVFLQGLQGGLFGQKGVHSTRDGRACE
jgi:hypothetical protein